MFTTSRPQFNTREKSYEKAYDFIVVSKLNKGGVLGNSFDEEWA